MNRKGNGMLVVVLVVVIVLGALGYLGSLMLRPVPSTKIVPTGTVNKGDIDRSGTADEEDRIMVRAHLDCAKSEPCWNTTVGKTKDGDNPLYVFDLDLNSDELISQADIDLIQ